MALRAGYYGLKRSIKNKLFILAASMPADISPDNPIAGKNDVLAGIDLTNDTTGWISENLLRFPYTEGSITRNGITWAVHSDGTITANGTATADEVFSLYDGNTLPKNAALTMIGGISNNIYMYVNGRKNGQWVKTYAEQRGEPKEFTILSTDDIDEIYVRLRINKDLVVDNLVIYPMICRSNVFKLLNSFRPYHKNVAEMIEGVNESTLLTSENDLNNVTKTGFYYWQSSVPTNSPENKTWCTMQVIKSGNIIKQIVYFSNDTIYFRDYSGSPISWQSWYKFTGTEVTSASLTKEDETKKKQPKRKL